MPCSCAILSILAFEIRHQDSSLTTSSLFLCIPFLKKNPWGHRLKRMNALQMEDIIFARSMTSLCVGHQWICLWNFDPWRFKAHGKNTHKNQSFFTLWMKRRRRSFIKGRDAVDLYQTSCNLKSSKKFFVDAHFFQCSSQIVPEFMCHLKSVTFFLNLNIYLVLKMTHWIASSKPALLCPLDEEGKKWLIYADIFALYLSSLRVKSSVKDPTLTCGWCRHRPKNYDNEHP